eukprot:m.130863 g.130863  ORF g.130863 m.130863 type:complete len:156 (-) comp13732_c0_seq2:46-513(-)
MSGMVTWPTAFGGTRQTPEVGSIIAISNRARIAAAGSQRPSRRLCSLEAPERGTQAVTCGEAPCNPYCGLINVVGDFMFDVVRPHGVEGNECRTDGAALAVQVSLAPLNSRRNRHFCGGCSRGATVCVNTGGPQDVSRHSGDDHTEPPKVTGRDR